MSCNRRIPYGYRMVNGQIEIHPKEAEIIGRIYREYIGGAVLKEIAARLTDERAEYLPGAFAWNKNRVKRILEDARYTGEGSYERIIEPEIQTQANAVKTSRNTQQEPLVTAEKKRLTHTVLCGACGGKMAHRTDRRLKNAEGWTCSCGAAVKLPIAEIERQITERFNAVIAAPELCEAAVNICREPSLEVRRLENEIARQMELPDADKEAVRELILQCAAQRFAECGDNRHITERLKADFENRGPLSAFSAELYESAADATILYPDGTIGVRLKNHTILRKETQRHASCHNDAQEDRAGDSGRSEKSA